jgi:ankyrin repeat protein
MRHTVKPLPLSTSEYRVAIPSYQNAELCLNEDISSGSSESIAELPTINTIVIYPQSLRLKEELTLLHIAAVLNDEVLYNELKGSSPRLMTSRDTSNLHYEHWALSLNTLPHAFLPHQCKQYQSTLRDPAEQIALILIRAAAALSVEGHTPLSPHHLLEINTSLNLTLDPREIVYKLTESGFEAPKEPNPLAFLIECKTVKEWNEMRHLLVLQYLTRILPKHKLIHEGTNLVEAVNTLYTESKEMFSLLKSGDSRKVIELLGSLDTQLKACLVNLPDPTFPIPEESYTPIFAAVMRNDAHLVEVLIKAGADVNAQMGGTAREEESFTPFDVACKSAAFDAAKALLKHEVILNSDQVEYTHEGTLQYESIGYFKFTYQELNNMASWDPIKLSYHFSQVMKKQANSSKLEIGSQKITMLHLAALFNNGQTYLDLLEANSNLRLSKDSLGLTPKDWGMIFQRLDFMPSEKCPTINDLEPWLTKVIIEITAAFSTLTGTLISTFKILQAALPLKNGPSLQVIKELVELGDDPNEVEENGLTFWDHLIYSCKEENFTTVISNLRRHFPNFKCKEKALMVYQENRKNLLKLLIEDYGMKDVTSARSERSSDESDEHIRDYKRYSANDSEAYEADTSSADESYSDQSSSISKEASLGPEDIFYFEP